MADYEKMYAVLCKAMDEVIDPLALIPEARRFSDHLQSALLEAEEIYIDTSNSAETPK